MLVIRKIIYESDYVAISDMVTNEIILEIFTSNMQVCLFGVHLLMNSISVSP